MIHSPSCVARTDIFKQICEDASTPTTQGIYGRANAALALSCACMELLALRQAVKIVMQLENHCCGTDCRKDYPCNEIEALRREQDKALAALPTEGG